MTHDIIRDDPEGFDAHAERPATGQPASAHVFRRDELLKVDLVPMPPPKDTCYLTVDEQAAPAAVARRREWLATPRS